MRPDCQRSSAPKPPLPRGPRPPMGGMGGMLSRDSCLNVSVSMPLGTSTVEARGCREGRGVAAISQELCDTVTGWRLVLAPRGRQHVLAVTPGFPAASSKHTASSMGGQASSEAREAAPAGTVGAAHPCTCCRSRTGRHGRTACAHSCRPRSLQPDGKAGGPAGVGQHPHKRGAWLARQLGRAGVLCRARPGWHAKPTA